MGTPEGSRQILEGLKEARIDLVASVPDINLLELINMLETGMLKAAEELDFERAARLRDQIAELNESPDLSVTRPPPERTGKKKSSKVWRPKSKSRRR